MRVARHVTYLALRCVTANDSMSSNPSCVLHHHFNIRKPRSNHNKDEHTAHLNLIAQPSPPLRETMCCVGYLYVCVLVGGVIQDVREACQPGPVNLSEIMCRWWIPLYGLLIWLEYLRDAITGMMRMRGRCCGLAYLGLPLCQLSVCSLLFLSFSLSSSTPSSPSLTPSVWVCVCFQWAPGFSLQSRSVGPLSSQKSHVQWLWEHSMLISETQYICKGSFIIFSLAKFLKAIFFALYKKQPVPEGYCVFFVSCEL